MKFPQIFDNGITIVNSDDSLDQFFKLVNRFINVKIRLINNKNIYKYFTFELTTTNLKIQPHIEKPDLKIYTIKELEALLDKNK